MTLKKSFPFPGTINVSMPERRLRCVFAMSVTCACMETAAAHALAAGLPASARDFSHPIRKQHALSAHLVRDLLGRFR
ncbi:hypothetical protein ElyMa_005481000 [Elysia marginata]|uniref:Uncharacterized protein n=1 Tax=Elysia marginata TaxID=1093978 RepID=A0AAV4EQN8_9GAST|nr:hypothetical protein ElyMa_005481000 [Elysia marginata]